MLLQSLAFLFHGLTVPTDEDTSHICRGTSRPSRHNRTPDISGVSSNAGAINNGWSFSRSRYRSKTSAARERVPIQIQTKALGRDAMHARLYLWQIYKIGKTLLPHGTPGYPHNSPTVVSAPHRIRIYILSTYQGGLLLLARAPILLIQTNEDTALESTLRLEWVKD